MSIKAQLKLDLTEAIRSRNEIVSGTIRMVLTAITNEEVAGKEARQLSEDEVIAVLSREAKKRREAAEAFADAGRADKATLEKAEGEVIAKYLPAQLTEADIAAMIAEAIAATGAAGPADMGKVMGAIKAKIAGKADGSVVSSLVKAALNKLVIQRNSNIQQFHYFHMQLSRFLIAGVLMAGNLCKLYQHQELANS